MLFTVVYTEIYTGIKALMYDILYTEQQTDAKVDGGAGFFPYIMYIVLKTILYTVC